MSDTYNTSGTKENYHPENELAFDLDAWFLVSGDMDDFIFYDEPDRVVSEK